MDSHEDILAERVRKFVSNMETKHKPLSAAFINNMRKIEENLTLYLVDDLIIDRVYEQIAWAEAHDNMKEIDDEFRHLLETFWEWSDDDVRGIN